MGCIVLFAERFDEMFEFYARLLNTAPNISESYVYITDGTNELYLHRVPEEYLQNHDESRLVRFDSPIKPIFKFDHSEMPSWLADEDILKKFESDTGAFFDVSDPDGNVICLQLMKLR